MDVFVDCPSCKARLTFVFVAQHYMVPGNPRNGADSQSKICECGAVVIVGYKTTIGAQAILPKMENENDEIPDCSCGCS